MTNELDPNCTQRLKNIEVLLDKIFRVMNGKDDEGGLVAKVLLLEQKVDAIPSPGQLKFYASFGGGVVMAFGFIGYAVINFFTK